MNARRIVYATLLSLILFPFLLLVNRELLVHRTEFSTGTFNLFFSVIEYLLFAVGIILSVVLLQKAGRQ